MERGRRGGGGGGRGYQQYGRGGNGGGRYEGGGGGYGGRGGGEYGGRGGGGYGGRGRGDYAPRGGGGRGGGRSPFGSLQLAPLRDAGHGTAAYPLKSVELESPAEAIEKLEKKTYDPDITQLVQHPRPKRPGFGTSGRAIRVRVNHFPVTFTVTQALHYDVEIERALPAGAAGPPVPSTRAQRPIAPDTHREIVRVASKANNWGTGWVYDGRKNIFATRQFLPRHAQTVTVVARDHDVGADRTFTVTTKWVNDIGLKELADFVSGRSDGETPQLAIQCLDVVLKHAVLMNPGRLIVGRGSIFNTDQGRAPVLGGGAEAWKGYSQSLRPSQGGLTLNVDMACTAFLESKPVLEYLAKAAGVSEAAVGQGLNPRSEQFKKARRAIQGLKVQAQHTGGLRRYKVRALSDKSARSYVFENEGTETNVAEYFEQRYRKRLDYPNAPLLEVGTRSRPIALPMELCVISPGQRRLKLTPEQTSEMIRHAAARPQVRANFITDTVARTSGFDSDPNLKEFGIKVEPRMIEMEARLLQPPPLEYESTQPPPRGGAWNLRNIRFKQGATIKAFAVVSFAPENRVGDARDPRGLPKFMFDLVSMLKKCGLNVPPADNQPPIIYHNGAANYPGETMQQAVEVARKHFRGTEPAIIFCLLPDTGVELYTQIKRASDAHLGIPSQCFVAAKANVGTGDPTRGRDQYTANLALKVNAKLGGVNCTLEPVLPWQRDPYMVFGADVTHFSPTATDKTPSVASVCGSINKDATQYASSIRLQSQGTEIILELQDIVHKLLWAYQQSNQGALPRRLIFYRDGVSDGQFNAVQHAEVAMIMQACRMVKTKTGKPYSPPLTFVVVQKRHNTRLFPLDPRDADRSGNIQPGTVVDRRIVHPTEFSFFLNSHAGLQGTNRPAHYAVLLDQNRFGADELQTFTYHLTYTFARCTRSVSVCPPAYYAHLAAARGRCLLDRLDTTEGTTTTEAKDRLHVSFAGVHQKLEKIMFYV